jgi:hypothetical protein
MAEYYWNHDIFAYLKDFDDPSLPFPQWFDKLIEAVREYNERHHTMFNGLKSTTNGTISSTSGGHLL